MKNLCTSISLLICLALVLTACDIEEGPSPSQVPTLSTLEVSDITLTAAKGGGNILSAGGMDLSYRGLVWGRSPNPTIEQNDGQQNEGNTVGTFEVIMRQLLPYTTYYVRAFAANSAGIGYGNEISFTTSKTQSTILSITTDAATNVNSASATSGGSVSGISTSFVELRGLVWDTLVNPTLRKNYGKSEDGHGSGNFNREMKWLFFDKTYYVKAYAFSKQDTSYGDAIQFTTAVAPEKIHCNGIPTTVVDVINPITGKTWMDRNLGASQAATSINDTNSYGDLYQWGRKADGHQCRNSKVLKKLSSKDQPPHGMFITVSGSSLNDWRSPQETNLWQGVNGINNPCPMGYRLPTENEFISERATWGSYDQLGAFNSPLKLPDAGMRTYLKGELSDYSSGYWSSTTIHTQSRYLLFENQNAFVGWTQRANGFSVRCIKD